MSSTFSFNDAHRRRRARLAATWLTAAIAGCGGADTSSLAAGNQGNSLARFDSSQSTEGGASRWRGSDEVDTIAFRGAKPSVPSGTAPQGQGTEVQLPTSLGAGAGARPKSGIGINVSSFNYWSTDFPVIDSFKRGSGWLTQCASSDPGCRNFSNGARAWDTLEQASLDLDGNGWVKSLPASTDMTTKFRTVSTLMFQGNGGAHPAGKYVVLYEGNGKLGYGLAGRKVEAESRLGRDVVEVSNSPDAGGLLITIYSTDPGNHLRNIRVLPPGGVCAHTPTVYAPSKSACSDDDLTPFEALHKTQVWHPAYLQDMRGFRVIRFLDWTLANTTRLSDWSQRPKATDAFWSSDKGVPIEAMLDLAKAASADPWITLTPYADDKYIREFALLARKLMQPSALLYVEHGNEPWNSAQPFGIAGAKYEALARQKWPSSQASGAHLRLNWYAYRSTQICKIVKQAFGDQTHRVRCIVNGQAYNPSVAEQILSCPLAQEELGVPCAKLVDALAVAPYFGHYIVEPKFKPQLDAWMAEPDGGLNRLFTELTGRNEFNQPTMAPLYAATRATPAKGALAAAREAMVSVKAVADKHNLPLVAYEGGQHMVPTRYSSDSELKSMLLRANRDKRMGETYLRNIEDWRAIGGQIFVQFAHANQGVSFGLKESQFQESSPKWDIVKQYRTVLPCWWQDCAN